MAPTQPSLWEEEKNKSLLGDMMNESTEEPLTPPLEEDQQQEADPCCTSSF